MVVRSAEVFFGALRRDKQLSTSPTRVVTSHDVRAYHGTLRHCLEGVAMLSYEAGGWVAIFVVFFGALRLVEIRLNVFRVDETYHV